MSIDKDTTAKVARLASIEMDDAQLEKAAPQLSGILDWIEQLSQVNTDNVEPLASVAGIELKRRKDEISDGDCVDAVLKNAPEETQNYFVVPKVVE